MEEKKLSRCFQKSSGTRFTISTAKLDKEEVITVVSIGRSSEGFSNDAGDVSNINFEDKPVPFESFENKNGFFANLRRDKSSSQLS